MITVIHASIRHKMIAVIHANIRHKMIAVIHVNIRYRRGAQLIQASVGVAHR